MAIDLLPEMTKSRPRAPEAWGPRHRLVVAMHLGGDKNKEIAKKICYHHNYISTILTDPRAVYEIERMASRVADQVIDTSLRIKLYSNDALDEIIEEIRSAKDVKVRQTAAFGILDRAGYVPIRDTREEAAPMLPEDVVRRMEETTKELVEYNGVYKEVKPKVREEEIIRDAYEADVGSSRGEAEDE